MSKQVLTPECRLHFPALFTPRQASRENPAKLSYQATLLLPPETDMRPFIAAVKAAYKEKFGADLDPRTLRHQPVRRTAELASMQAAVESGEWWFLRASSKYKPNVVDRANQKVTDEKAVYAGVYVRAYVTAWAWMHPQNGKGVSWNIDGVQVIKAGEVLKTTAPVAFEALEPIAQEAPPSGPRGAAGGVAGLWD